MSGTKKKGFLILLITLLGMSRGFEVNVFCNEEVHLSYVSDRGIDVDGDGLFEYLEIRLEANISSPGTYILEGSDLFDRSGEIISVSAYNQLYLDAGENVLFVLFDGRTIHSSGLDPVNVSYIGLIQEDYMLADLLNNIPLSREYHFDEFEPLPDYEIGVEVGDWARYRVLYAWSSTNQSATGPGVFPDEIFFNVSEVASKMVALETRFRYGAEEVAGSVVSGYLEQDSSIFPFLIPADLNAGDSFSQTTNATIVDVRIEDIYGNDREINRFHDEKNVSQDSTEYILEEEYFWDRKTGALMRSWFTITSSDLLTGVEEYYNLSFSIDSTNIIKQGTSIKLEAPPEIRLGETLNITAILLDFLDEGVEGQRISFLSAEDEREIGEGITDSEGHVEFKYEPEATGEHRIKTVFSGSGELRSSESSISFTVIDEASRNSFKQYVYLIGAVLIIMVVILLIFVRKKL